MNFYKLYEVNFSHNVNSNRGKYKMALKILDFSSFGKIKDLMTCCGGTVEFVGIFGILLLIAGTLQMGSGVYFMLTLPVFSVASNIWTGVISGLAGTVLTYFGCSDQSRRRPYVLFTFCIVTIVANVANIVITQVGDKTLNVFNEESFLSNLDDDKLFTLKIGVWVTTGATILSLTSAFILANYLFCVQLKGKCEADKQSPLLKTISEEILQKTSRPKSKKGGSPNRFFPPSRLIHASKVENPRLNSVGLWIPWKDVGCALPIYSTHKELSIGGRQSRDICSGGGSSLNYLSGEGVSLRNYNNRPNTVYRNGVVNLGATLDDDNFLNNGRYSYPQNFETQTLGRREKNTKIGYEQRFSTFKPRKSRVSQSHYNLQKQDSNISKPTYGDTFLDDNMYSRPQNFETKTQGIQEENTKIGYEQRFSTFKPRKSRVASSHFKLQEPDSNMSKPTYDNTFLDDNGYSRPQNFETKTQGIQEENAKIGYEQRFSTFKPKKSLVSASHYAEPESNISMSPKNIENNISLKEGNPKQYDEKGDADKVHIKHEEKNIIVEKAVDQSSADEKAEDKDKFCNEGKENVENYVDNLRESGFQIDSESWLNILPSVFTNIMEISDFNEFINNLIAQDSKTTIDDKNHDQTECNQIPPKQETDNEFTLKSREPSEDSRRKDSNIQDNFRSSSPRRSKRLKRPTQKPPLPPQQETTPSTSDQTSQ